VALDYDYQTTLFQPVGGMDRIAQAFAREVGDLVRLRAKVTAIRQDYAGVSAVWHDTETQVAQETRADWCVYTIPLSVLSQIEMNVGTAMATAIDAVPYAAAVKIGLQFRRRFWESDEAI
jgi:monoamine oxidase